MNVKISYTIPFEKVPETITELMRQSCNELETVGGKLKMNAFDEHEETPLQKMKRIDDVRKELSTIDLRLGDCYSILASYNKALADMHMPKREEQTSERMADERGSGSNPTESGNGAA